MENTNEILSKIAELSIVNTNEINKLKSKDEEIITSVGTLNEFKMVRETKFLPAYDKRNDPKGN